MLFQDRVVAVVADSVEVQVEALLAGGQAEGAQPADEAGEQRRAGFAAGPVGVGAQVGGLGQGGQAEEERQPFVVGDLVDVVGTGMRVAAASSRVAMECQADSWLVAG